MLCHSHVHYIIGLEIHFGRTASAFNDNGIIGAVQTLQGIFHRLEGLEGVSFVIFPCAEIADGLSHDDDLGAGVSRWLQQYGIHVHHGIKTRGLSLGNLGTAHFQSFLCYIGIKGHVLRLEGNHPPAFPIKNAAKCRRQNALANMGAGALQHNIIRHPYASEKLLKGL